MQMRKFITLYKKSYIGILVWFVLLNLLCMKNTVYADKGFMLKGEVSDYQSVLLTWESAAPDYVYQIQKANGKNEIFSTIAVISGQAGKICCYDNNVKLGSTCYYKIVRLLDGQLKEESNVISVEITLSTPANVKAAKLKDSRVKLSWSKVKAANGYLIYRSTKKSSGYKKIASTKKNMFIDVSVKHGKVYYYKVEAYKRNHSELTSRSKQYVSVYMKPGTPNLKGCYTRKKIKLSWKKVSGAKEYYLYKKNKKGKYCLMGKTKMLYYFDCNVIKGKSYEYKIVAAYKKDGKEIKSSYSKSCKVFASTIDPKKKMIALTFDDGPGRYTKEIVQCLKKYNSKATFFVVGSNVDSYKSALKAADKAGCEIGNHSYSHSDFTRLSRKEIREQISETDKKVKNVIGKNTSLVRTPGGATDRTVQNTVGKPIILWSIDTLDWKTRDRDKTVKAVMNNVKDGDIVLMHDIHEPSKEAAIILIKELNRKGYQLVTVSELAQYRGYDLKKGSVYRRLRKK